MSSVSDSHGHSEASPDDYLSSGIAMGDGGRDFAATVFFGPVRAIDFVRGYRYRLDSAETDFSDLADHPDTSCWRGGRR